MKIKTLIIMGLLSTTGSNLSAQDEKIDKRRDSRVEGIFQLGTIHI